MMAQRGIGRAPSLTRHAPHVGAPGSGFRPHHTHIYVRRIVIPGNDRGDGMAKKKTTQVPADEPMGIIISRGAEQDLAPTVLAFVWGPVDAEMPELFAA